jgi:hypothetical protein
VAITEPDGSWHDIDPILDVGVYRFEGPYKSIFVPLAHEWMASTVCTKWKSWTVLENTGLTDIVPLTTYVLASSPRFSTFIRSGNSVAFLNMRERGFSRYDINVFHVLFSHVDGYLYTMVSSMSLGLGLPIVGRNYPIVNLCRSHDSDSQNWEWSADSLLFQRIPGIVVQLIDNRYYLGGPFGQWANTSFMIPAPSIPPREISNIIGFDMWNVDDIPIRFSPLWRREETHLSVEEATLDTLAANEAAARFARVTVVEAKLVEICGAIILFALAGLGV